MTLAWLGASFVLGVILGPLVPAPFGVTAAGAFAALAYHRRSTAAWLPLLAACGLCLGISRAPGGESSPGPHDLPFYNGRPVTVTGQIAAEPDIRDTGSNYVVAVRQVTVEGRTMAVQGSVQVHTARSQQLDYGDGVQLTGRLLEPSNSSTVPYRDILRRRGIGSEMRFPRTIDLGQQTTGPLGWIVPLRQRIETGIDAWLPEPEAALLIAITLGARSASLGALAPVFVSTGLIHLVAISGIKVAMVAGTIWAAVGMLRRRTLTLLLSLSGLTLYVALTGATASGVRSAIMWGLVFVAAYLGRGTVALVSLSFAAAVMVAADPSLPWDIGFQLSTLGTFAIVAFTGPLARMLRRVPSPFREAVAVTVAAQLGTVPVVAAGFHSLSLAGPIANGLVLPLLPALIVLGFVLGTVSGFAALANPAGALCYALLHAIITVSQWLASEHSALTVPAFAPIVATAYYLVGGALALFLLRRVNWAPLGHWSSRAGEIGLALAVAAAGLTFSEAQAAPGDRLMYLGSGGGLLLQSAGRTALIDGSPKPLAYLEALGSRLGYRTRTIDLIVVTDARAGNVAALTAVLAHYRVGAVLDVGAEYPSAGYASWRERLRELHIPAYALRTGATVSLGGVRLTAVGPDGVCPLPQNCAGVLRLSDRSRSMLLAGAASRREQVESVFRGVSLKADELVFSAPEGIDGRFLRAVGAKKVWVMGGAAEGGVSLLGAGSEHTWDLRS